MMTHKPRKLGQADLIFGVWPEFISRYVVVVRRTAVREDPGSNLTAAGRVYDDSHCDIQPWAGVVHPYCSA